MFSGKTSELLNRYERYTIGNKRCLLIKFRGDTRYDNDSVVTHSGKTIPSTAVEYLYEVDSIIPQFDVICIDEVQFYKDAHIFCDKWANQGKIVEACGINGTFHKTPFPIISKLIPQASNITFLKAICRETGQDAIYSFRHQTDKVGDIVIGGSDTYKAVDRFTYNQSLLTKDLYEKFLEFSQLYNDANKLNKVYSIKQTDMTDNVSFMELINK